MYKYTLGFIYCEETDQVLLLNRQKAPWMGRWNGVGGKLDPQESPMLCIVRETFEETGLQISLYEDRGVLRWFRDGVDLNGVHLFVAKVDKSVVDLYSTPKTFCHEGILDWKKLDWVLNEDNSGVVDNIQILLAQIIHKKDQHVWAAHYAGKQLQSVEPISSWPQ